MNKKIIIAFLIIIIAIISAIIYNSIKDKNEQAEPQPIIISPSKQEEPDKIVEVTSDKVEKIREESYLDVLLQIQSFDSLYVNYEPLLEAAMRIASMQGLLQSETEGVYVEYVPRSVVHDIIFELSGVRVDEPIEIDDFYYLYDAENDYYYIVPIGVNWVFLDKIDTIQYSNKNDQYIVKCSGRLGSEESGMITTFPNMELKLKYKPNNKYVKYQLVSIFPGVSNVEISD